MIRSFSDRATQRLYEGQRVRQFSGFQVQAERRLAILDAATSLMNLRGLPSNRLEALGGDREGQFSIRINQQWRLCFKWDENANQPYDVEIVDYHR